MSRSDRPIRLLACIDPLGLGPLAGDEMGRGTQTQGAPMHYFRITLDDDGYRARFYYNGELMWWTEGYKRRATAENAIRSLRVHAASAPLR